MGDQRTGVPFVDLRRTHDPISQGLLAAMGESLDRGDFILGEAIEAFEAAFAAYCDAGHGVGVDSGTSALELALRALDIGPGDEVITTANTFIATALAIHHAGATPVLVDVDRDTANMDVALLEKALTPRTKAIIPVHLYGQPADMAPIMEFAGAGGIRVIEDASQAHGARYMGARVGGLGDVAAFSLYPAKNLGAFGDAGVLVTNDEDLAERLRLLRNYGSPKKYHHTVPGFNRRLDTLQARVLLVKLPHLDRWNESRRRSARYYSERLSRLASVGIPIDANFAESVYHLYVIRTPHRDALQQHLSAAGIGTVIHYPVPIHLQPAFAHLGFGPGSFPVSERLAGTSLSLPMFPDMTRAELDRVVSEVDRFLFGLGAAAS